MFEWIWGYERLPDRARSTSRDCPEHNGGQRLCSGRAGALGRDENLVKTAKFGPRGRRREARLRRLQHWQLGRHLHDDAPREAARWLAPERVVYLERREPELGDRPFGPCDHVVEQVRRLLVGSTAQLSPLYATVARLAQQPPLLQLVVMVKNSAQ